MEKRGPGKHVLIAVKGELYTRREEADAMYDTIIDISVRNGNQLKELTRFQGPKTKTL
jgi:hypothetical protein